MASSADRRLAIEDLSPDQREVFDAMAAWVKDPASGLLRMGGFAGVGKSSLLGVLAHHLSKTKLQVAYIAFTGRAASVLDRKLRACGVRTTGLAQRGEGDVGEMFADNLGRTPFCGTIHRLLYKPVIDEETAELRGWARREHLDRDYDLIVIDEASMVGGTLLRDIQTHEVPILAVGDHGQLPPVMDSGDLMDEPDLRIEKIHRQAEGSPIIALSRVLREEGVIEIPAGSDAVRCRPKDEIEAVLSEALTVGVDPLDVGILSYTNRTRVWLNTVARRARGRRGSPTAGDVLLCLRNAPPIFNGMRGVVLESKAGYAPWHLETTIVFPEEGVPRNVYTLCAPQFNREKTYETVEELQDRGIACDRMKEAGLLFDWGYGLTVHKSQGSSFKHVVLYLDRDEKPWQDDWRRWAYTAATRASERITVLRND